MHCVMCRKCDRQDAQAEACMTLLQIRACFYSSLMRDFRVRALMSQPCAIECLLRAADEAGKHRQGGQPRLVWFWRWCCVPGGEDAIGTARNWTNCHHQLARTLTWSCAGLVAHVKAMCFAVQRLQTSCCCSMTFRQLYLSVPPCPCMPLGCTSPLANIAHSIACVPKSKSTEGNTCKQVSKCQAGEGKGGLNRYETGGQLCQAHRAHEEKRSLACSSMPCRTCGCISSTQWMHTCRHTCDISVHMCTCVNRLYVSSCLVSLLPRSRWSRRQLSERKKKRQHLRVSTRWRALELLL